MIEVQNLTKHYGPVTAIRDVSFSVAAGQIVGFLGPNGAGKSTTMRILACFLPASSGTARVAGFDVFRGSMEVRCWISERKRASFTFGYEIVNEAGQTVATGSTLHACTDPATGKMVGVPPWLGAIMPVAPAAAD